MLRWDNVLICVGRRLLRTVTPVKREETPSHMLIPCYHNKHISLDPWILDLMYQSDMRIPSIIHLGTGLRIETD